MAAPWRMRSPKAGFVTLRQQPRLESHLSHLFRPVLHVACGGLSAQIQPEVEHSHLWLQVDAKVVLGDRLVSITLARAWAGLTRWQRMRLLWDLMRLGGSSSSQDQLTDKLESYRGVRGVGSVA